MGFETLIIGLVKSLGDLAFDFFSSSKDKDQDFMKRLDTILSDALASNAHLKDELQKHDTLVDAELKKIEEEIAQAKEVKAVEPNS